MIQIEIYEEFEKWLDDILENSDIPENTVCIEGYGNAFRHGDTESLKKLLAFCLEHEHLKERYFKEELSPEQVQQKRESFIRKYDWDAITDHTLEAYVSVISTLR